MNKRGSNSVVLTVMKDLEDPCIDDCTYDYTHDFCLGCGRNLLEISIWTTASYIEKLVIEKK